MTLIYLGKNLFYSAKKNLFKDQSAWSGKDIKIKYNNHKDGTESKVNYNFLKMIAEESKIYLDDQLKKEQE